MAKKTSPSALAHRAWGAVKTRALPMMFNHEHSENRMFYGNHHQLSFDETPSFSFSFHLQKTSSGRWTSCLPCIKPAASFDSDLEHDEIGIDTKAEEFIAEFYYQMKLQRQTSLSPAP